VVAWLVAAAHEVPQELGDFGILVHSGWQRRAALAYNLASASTVLVGAVVAYALAAQVQVAVLMAFAAGNFLYIALADLVPELTTSPAPPRQGHPHRRVCPRPAPAAPDRPARLRLDIPGRPVGHESKRS
jgi:zinc transporter ZupT